MFERTWTGNTFYDGFSAELTSSNLSTEHDLFWGLLCLKNWLFGVDVRCENNSLTFSCGMYFRPLCIYDRLFLFHDSVVSDSLRSITLMNPSKQKLTYNGNSTKSFAIFSQPAVVKSDFFSRFPLDFRKYNYIAQCPFRYKSLLVIVKFSNWLFNWRQGPVTVLQSS